jgi:hypothetical protein
MHYFAILLYADASEYFAISECHFRSLISVTSFIFKIIESYLLKYATHRHFTVPPAPAFRSLYSLAPGSGEQLRML